MWTLKSRKGRNVTGQIRRDGRLSTKEYEILMSDLSKYDSSGTIDLFIDFLPTETLPACGDFLQIKIISNRNSHDSFTSFSVLHSMPSTL